jgi:ribonuclease D
MKKTEYEYELIDNKEDLKHLCSKLAKHPWVGIDTEFISEKRYEPLLCLIQIVSPEGLYLLDSLVLEDLQPFLDLLGNPDILKITHSGENDYRLFYQKYGITPVNLFDTQIAAGLVSVEYPTSFQRLVQALIRKNVPKGQTVTKWDARPLSNKQIHYALNDVYFLPDLWKKLQTLLEKQDRVKWAEEEFCSWEDPLFFEVDLYEKTANHNLFKSLPEQRQRFLLRLYRWRQSEARKKNQPVDSFLPEKALGLLARHMSSEKKAVFEHRHLPKKFLSKNWDTLLLFFEAPAGPDEYAFLDNIPEEKPIDEKHHNVLDLIYWILKQRCQEASVAPALLLRGNALRKLKSSSMPINQTLKQGWRRELLGETLIHWLENPQDIRIDWNDERLMISSLTTPAE